MNHMTHDDVEVADGVFQSEDDVETNNEYDGAKDEKVQDEFEESERHDAVNADHLAEALK